jgi:hypothetical protein
MKTRRSADDEAKMEPEQREERQNRNQTHSDSSNVRVTEYSAVQLTIVMLEWGPRDLQHFIAMANEGVDGYGTERTQIDRKHEKKAQQRTVVDSQHALRVWNWRDELTSSTVVYPTIESCDPCQL